MQIMDSISIKRRKYFIYEEPLEQHLSDHDLHGMFIPPHTACWRGYIATWKLKYNKLYLIGLKGFDGTDSEHPKLSLQDLFPGQTEIFADWFTGNFQYISCKSDELYVPFSPNWIHITFNKGVLINSKNVSKLSEYIKNY